MRGGASTVSGVDLSGIIFVVLALAWAGYLIPMALKHHDEVSRSRSIDRFSTTMRVLARREPVNRREAKLVVTPPRTGSSRMILPSRPTSPGESNRAPVEAVPARGASSTTPATSRRAAARRRRHLLMVLLLAVAAVAVVAYFAMVTWWAVAIPAGLTLAYLALCFVVVRHQQRAVVRRRQHRPQPATAVHPGRRTAAPQGDAIPLASAPPVREADDDGVDGVVAQAAWEPAEVDVALNEPEPVQSSSTGRLIPQPGSLWDPVPITLPTYVTKPRATRTVRTIELNEPGAWSSGHSAADAKLVDEARTEAAGAACDKGVGPSGTQAVGT